ncbi:MAG: hypothetical protein M5U08_11290 [Burkholderiales bacterium]|nr:hypothetical protein [Burkholderiales bacterium]
MARAAALYASARHGALMSGLDAIERLAAATSFAFEDVGVLSESTWHIERVVADEAYVDTTVAARWLLQLMGAPGEHDAAAGFPDECVAAWREHGAVLPLPEERGIVRVLHVGGARLLARTWGIALSEPDRRSLVRRLRDRAGRPAARDRAPGLPAARLDRGAVRSAARARRRARRGIHRGPGINAGKGSNRARCRRGRQQ